MKVRNIKAMDEDVAADFKSSQSADPDHLGDRLARNSMLPSSLRLGNPIRLVGFRRIG